MDLNELLNYIPKFTDPEKVSSPSTMRQFRDDGIKIGCTGPDWNQDNSENRAVGFEQRCCGRCPTGP